MSQNLYNLADCLLIPYVPAMINIFIIKFGLNRGQIVGEKAFWNVSSHRIPCLRKKVVKKRKLTKSGKMADICGFPYNLARFNPTVSDKTELTDDRRTVDDGRSQHDSISADSRVELKTVWCKKYWYGLFMQVASILGWPAIPCGLHGDKILKMRIIKR